MIDRSRLYGPSPHLDRPLEMAILVNSSDGFRDCWYPFFQLLETHWPGCRFPLYLNVEEATYEHPSLEVRCLNHPRLPSGINVPRERPADRLAAGDSRVVCDVNAGGLLPRFTRPRRSRR
jgi:hypothetical protein